jgi:acetylornithine/N-succinyldiaminopimelate aminotransferase
MNTEQIKKLEDAYTADTYARYPVALVKGKGCRAWDPEGKEYIDFTAGIGVNSLGFCEPGWVKAVSEQVATMQHISNLYYTQPCAEAAEKLIAITGMSKVFFANSGAEANEGAIKAARKYSYMKYNPDESPDYKRYKIVTLTGSFHGRTMMTVTATGQDSFHRYFGPFAPGFAYAVTGDVDELRDIIDDETCAVMVEFVQGEGGVNKLSEAFAKEIEKICKEKDVLLIADEVQAGVGRTGKFFAYEHYGVTPDIVTVAKGIGGGLPLGCVLLGEKAKGALLPGDHGSTYGGGPVVSAAASYVLSKFDDPSFLAGIAERAAYFRGKLEELPGVKAVTGIGFMIGLELDGIEAKELVARCYESGLLILTAKDRARLLPPLIISKEDMDAGLAILKESLEDLSR